MRGSQCLFVWLADALVCRALSPLVYLTCVYTAGYELREKLTVKQFNRSVFAGIRIKQRIAAAGAAEKNGRYTNT